MQSRMQLSPRASMACVAIVLWFGACATVAAQDLQVIANPVDAVLPSSTVAAAAAAAAGVPLARLRRNSRSQAAMALRNATITVPRAAVNVDDRSSEVKAAAAVCAANSLTQTSFSNHCRIITRWPDGTSTSCSATKVAGNRLATAGRCVYMWIYGGWARAIDVYCTGANACGVARTTFATDVTTTRRWVDSSSASSVEGSAWDVAVIRTNATLPGTAITAGQYLTEGTARTRLTGYPSLVGVVEMAGVTGGEVCSGYNGCAQFSSTGTMEVQSTDVYAGSVMDVCTGNPGDAVVDLGVGYLVAIMTSKRTTAVVCTMNMFAPSVLDKNVDEGAACTRSTGGASIPCLSRRLPA